MSEKRCSQGVISKKDIIAVNPWFLPSHRRLALTKRRPRGLVPLSEEEWDGCARCAGR